MLQEAELHFSFRFLPVSVQLARLKSLFFFFFYKSVVLRSAFQLLFLQFFSADNFIDGEKKKKLYVRADKTRKDLG